MPFEKACKFYVVSIGNFQWDPHVHGFRILSGFTCVVTLHGPFWGVLIVVGFRAGLGVGLRGVEAEKVRRASKP